MRVSSPAAPLLIAILAMVACQPEPTVAPAPTAAPRDEGIVVPDDAYAIAGGVLMGFAARLARGCTSGQALTGGAVMAFGSWIFMLAVFAGGYVTAPLARRQWK